MKINLTVLIFMIMIASQTLATTCSQHIERAFLGVKYECIQENPIDSNYLWKSFIVKNKPTNEERVMKVYKCNDVNEEYFAFNDYHFMAKMNHPNFRKVYTSIPFYSKHKVCIVFVEHISNTYNKSLKELLDDPSSNLSIADKLEILFEIAKSIKMMQKYRLIHTNLDLTKIRVNSEKKIKMPDFTWAKEVPKEAPMTFVERGTRLVNNGVDYSLQDMVLSRDLLCDSQFTDIYTILEKKSLVKGQFGMKGHFEDHPFNLKSDVYSLGVIFYYMFNGKLPHVFSGRFQEFLDLLRSNPAFEFSAGLPLDLVFVNFFTLVYLPEDRISVDELLKWLLFLYRNLDKRNKFLTESISVTHGIACPESIVREMGLKPRDYSHFLPIKETPFLKSDSGLKDFFEFHEETEIDWSVIELEEWRDNIPKQFKIGGLDKVAKFFGAGGTKFEEKLIV